MFIPSDGLVIDLNPPVDTAAYTSGDVLAVPIEIPKAVMNTKGLAFLRSLIVLDAINQKGAIDVLFFDRDPGSVGALNAALDLSTTQLSYMVGMISVAGADYITLKAATNAAAVKQPNLMMPAKTLSTSFWMVLVARAAITYTAATNLRIKLVLERQS